MKYLFILALLLMPYHSNAGDGHDHGESAFANGGYLNSFELSESTIKNLDLKTTTVSKHFMQDSIKLPCLIKNPPEQSSIITAPYMSRVEKIHVSIGDSVQKGQTLFTVFSFKAVKNIELKSPINGIVSAQNVKIGEIVQQDTNIAEISTMKYFYAEAQAYLSDDISHINIGDKALIQIDGTHSDETGVVKSFSPIVNAENNTKAVIIYFESSDNHIFPNMHCEVSIFLNQPRLTLAIPQKALLGEFGQYFVFLKHGDHFERQEIVTGFENGNQIEVLEGLKEGDEIVINGNYQLQYISTSASEHKEEKND